MEKERDFRLNNPELNRLCNAMVDTPNVTPGALEEIKMLPTFALTEIITLRYKKTAFQATQFDGGDVDYQFRQQFLSDMNLIKYLLDENEDYDFRSKQFDVNLVGNVVLQDINGLLDCYKRAFEIGRVNPIMVKYDNILQSVVPINKPDSEEPYRALDVLDELTQEMKEKTKAPRRSGK